MSEPPFASEPESRHNGIRESQPHILTEIEYRDELYFDSFIHRRRLYDKHSQLIPLGSVRCYLCGYVIGEKDYVYRYDGVCSLNKHPRYYCNSCNENIVSRHDLLVDVIDDPKVPWDVEHDVALSIPFDRLTEFCCLLGQAKRPRKSTCVLWTGRRNRDGYGIIRLAGVDFYVHRIAYLNVHRRIFSGREVMHVCHEMLYGSEVPLRNCFNPNHLKAGSHAENMRNRLSGNGQTDSTEPE